MNKGDLVVWKSEKNNVGIILKTRKKYITVFWIEGIMDYSDWEKIYIGVISEKR